MKLLVYLTDSRTVYLLDRRGLLSDLVGEAAMIGAAQRPSYRVVKGLWNPLTGEYVWSTCMLRYLRKASIAYVEEAPHGLVDAVAPPEREPELALA